MTMLNDRSYDVAASVNPDDRNIPIPSDVAALRRHLGRMNLGAESVFGC